MPTTDEPTMMPTDESPPPTIEMSMSMSMNMNMNTNMGTFLGGVDVMGLAADVVANVHDQNNGGWSGFGRGPWRGAFGQNLGEFGNSHRHIQEEVEDEEQDKALQRRTIKEKVSKATKATKTETETETSDKEMKADRRYE
jgi:hypothetical protein